MTLLGNGTLNLWTQSVSAAAYPGKICVWLFERHSNAHGAPVDTPAIDPAHREPHLLHVLRDHLADRLDRAPHPLRASPLGNLGPNSRLGLAIQVEKAGTSGGGMQFLYDEPSFDSRLELKTQSVLPF